MSASRLLLRDIVARQVARAWAVYSTAERSIAPDEASKVLNADQASVELRDGGPWLARTPCRNGRE